MIHTHEARFTPPLSIGRCVELFCEKAPTIFHFLEEWGYQLERVEHFATEAFAQYRRGRDEIVILCDGAGQLDAVSRTRSLVSRRTRTAFLASFLDEEQHSSLDFDHTEESLRRSLFNLADLLRARNGRFEKN